MYETCECDIEEPNIHRFPWVDGLSTGPPGHGRHIKTLCHDIISLLSLNYV